MKDCEKKYLAVSQQAIKVLACRYSANTIVFRPEPL